IAEPLQTWELLRDCQSAVSTPLFRCVDLEGGMVDRLKAVLAPAPAAATVAATGDRKLFRRQGRLIGDEVRALGFNTDFAPVLDLGFLASRSVLGTRTASDDPKKVTLYAREFLRGLREARVLGCGKHFPGLGEAALDTHHELPAVDKSWPRLWAEDLYPYRALKREMTFVMVAHAAYPAVTRDRTPASISRKWIAEILRKKIGYKGLVVSDDLEMGGVLAATPIEQAAVETLRAGADLFLVCHSEELVRRSYEAVLREAERDRSFARRVQQAARRVLAFKKRSREMKVAATAPSKKKVERLRSAMLRFADGTR
ncbi:MAG TPA: glycoside hydrolase family 3 N-terminal domain-containing protein, partial [Terriglobales bacterium]|nr:glycoside hydrolase family 3 N-terminal domain-containing protein [Terriglobales bacterium]